MKLSLKQKRFIKQYLRNGGNGTQAAMAVYDVKNYNTAHAIASENLQKPTIRHAIELALEARGVDDAHISELLQEATVAGLGHKPTNADALRGIDMMLKLKGAYQSPVQKSAHLRVETRDWQREAEIQSFDEAFNRLKKLQERTAEIIAYIEGRKTS